MLELLVGILDHDDRSVDHRADGDGDPAQRHDVGVDALQIHHGNRCEHSKRQSHHRDQRRAEVEQERARDERDDEQFLGELLQEVRDGSFDQGGAVIDRDDFDSLREAALQLVELVLDGLDHGLRVGALADDDDPAGDLAFAVQLGDAAAELGRQLHPGDVADRDRDAACLRPQRDVAEVLQGPEIAGHAHHIFGARALDHRSARLVVGLANGLDHVGYRDAIELHPLGVELDLEGLDHAADARHLGDPVDLLELVPQEPVLERAQLGKVVPAAAVDQGIFEGPADAGCIGPERGRDIGRQAISGLAQIFERPRARPVEVGAVLEEDRDEAVAEEGEAAHRLHLRRRQHGARQRIGDLRLDRARRLAGIAGPDDDLRVRQVRQSVDRRARQRVDARHRQEQRAEQHEQPVGDRPADDALDHRAASGAMRSMR